MIYLSKEELRDQIYACWIGKNIGGTLGAPYEGTQELLDINGFASQAGEPLPNDDLDLQIVWLKALIEVGAQNLVDPFACKDIIDNLPKVMEKYKIDDLSSIIGGAH